MTAGDAPARAEIARAALQSVAFQTRDLLDAMLADAEGLPREVLRVDGGMTASDWAMQALADQKIRMSGLETWSGRKYPSDLSGGMRKRAALARALALDPPLLFLDEPTAGLDPITAAGFDQLIRDLQKSLGLTVFLVTHDVDTLAVTCDRIAVLGEKRVLAIGTMDELRREPHPWIQDYFGGPRGRGAIMGAG